MTTDAEVITQKYIRRYPDSRRTKSWAGRMVHIRTENGVWRVDGHGYTYAHEPDAWVLPFEDRRTELGTTGNKKPTEAYYDQLETEIGDVLIYLDLLAAKAGLSLEGCVRRAFNEKSDELNMPVRI